MNKRIILALVAVLIFGVVAFMAKIAIDRPNDAQAFVNTALVKSLELDSMKVKSSVQATANLGEMGNGQLAIEIEGQASDATAYLPTIDYQINLDSKVNLGEQVISVIASGEIKIIEEVIYGQLGNFTITGADAMNLPSAQVEAIVRKWFGLSFAELKKADLEVAAVFEEQKTQQLAMRENLKKLLMTKDLLLVKKMPICLKDLQPVEVVLNTDLLTSDEFLTEMEEMFTPADLSNEAENPFEISEEQKAKIRQAVSELASQINSTIILKIDRNDGMLRDYSAVLDFDLSNFGLSGTANVAVSSEISEINQPQIITAPAKFEEIDPLELVRIPEPEEEFLDGELETVEE